MASRSRWHEQGGVLGRREVVHFEPYRTDILGWRGAIEPLNPTACTSHTRPGLGLPYMSTNYTLTGTTPGRFSAVWQSQSNCMYIPDTPWECHIYTDPPGTTLIDRQSDMAVPIQLHGHGSFGHVIGMFLVSHHRTPSTRLPR